MSKLLLLVLLNSLALGIGCNTQPHPGIEAGNPNVSVKSIRVLPKDGDEIYAVLIIDETTADVTQLQQTEIGQQQNVLDEVVVPYSLSRNVLSLDATFADSRSIAVTAAFSTSGDSVSGTLQVDGGFTEACFEVPGQTPSCETSVDTPYSSSGTGAPPSVSPTVTVVGPVQIKGGDDQGAGDDGISQRDATADNITLPDGSSVAVKPDPYAAYCTLIDGRPACKIPPDFQTEPVTNQNKAPDLSEISRSVTLTPNLVQTIGTLTP